MTALRHSCAEFCRNLQFCDLQKNQKNLRICDLRTGTPKKLADLQLRNEPKNLRTFKQVFLPNAHLQNSKHFFRMCI